MYIAPNTTIKILKNIPIDKTYENTVYYADKDKQYAAFNTYTKYTLDNYSYQRNGIGVIRVQLKYEDLYDCNYMMFRNTSFENKWFYAFITGVSYISNDVSEIYYELDVMQTWCYDYSFLPSFVQRRHSDSDVLYENTQPEGLELGSEYRSNSVTTFGITSKLNYILLTSDIPSTDISTLTNSWRVHNGLINNVYTGLYVFGTTSTSEMQTYLQAMIDEGKEGAVVSFYMAPTGNATETQEREIEQVQTLDGYTPTNKKLYTSPFYRLDVTNNAGINNVLKFEYFEGTPKFRLLMLSFPQAVARVTPENYTVGTTQADQGVVYATYPICGFAGDAYKAWFAQNKNQYITALNTIGRTYDTNRAIAQNNYSMSQRNAQAAAENAGASANTALSNAENSIQAQSQNVTANAIYGIASNTVQGVIDVTAGDPTKAASNAASAILGIGGNVVNGLTQMNSLNAQSQNAQASAATSLAIAQRNLTTAMQNAATTQASSQLSALTAKQNAIDQLMAKKQDMQNVPDSAHGNGLCDALNFADDNAKIQIVQQCVKKEYAERIDNYFNMFGYAQNRLYSSTELNNRINRPHYTYLRTVGVSIKGAMNQADIVTIKGIYDNGITTWDTLEDVGNYDLDNKPTA